MVPVVGDDGYRPLPAGHSPLPQVASSRTALIRKLFDSCT